jgi:hypothetical protein
VSAARLVTAAGRWFAVSRVIGPLPVAGRRAAGVAVVLRLPAGQPSAAGPRGREFSRLATGRPAVSLPAGALARVRVVAAGALAPVRVVAAGALSRVRVVGAGVLVPPRVIAAGVERAETAGVAVTDDVAERPGLLVARIDAGSRPQHRQPIGRRGSSGRRRDPRAQPYEVLTRLEHPGDRWWAGAETLVRALGRRGEGHRHRQRRRPGQHRLGQYRHRAERADREHGGGRRDIRLVHRGRPADDRVHRRQRHRADEFLGDRSQRAGRVLGGPLDRTNGRRPGVAPRPRRQLGHLLRDKSTLGTQSAVAQPILA